MEEHQELLDQMKKEAEDAVRLLAPLVERRREEEIKKDGSLLFFFISHLILFIPPNLFLQNFFSGLIIVEAQYGALSNFSSRGLGGLGLPTSKPTIPSSSTSSSNPDHIDVKIALQALVNESQLIIPAGRSKAGLLGFYDCALGSKKR